MQRVLTLIIAIITLTLMSAFSIPAAGQPIDPRTHVNTLIARGDLWAAAAYLQHWVDSAPDSVNARLLAEVRVSLQDWPRAIDALQGLVALVPDDAWAHQQLGYALAPFDPLTAAHHLERAAAILTDPQQGAVAAQVAALLRQRNLLSAAGVLLDGGEWGYAEHFFMQLAFIGQATAESLASAALARLAQGKAADHWMRAAVNRAPDSPQVAYLEGRYALARREFDVSVAAYWRGAMLDPLNPIYYAAIAGVLAETGDLDGMNYWYGLAEQVAGDDPASRAQVEALKPQAVQFDVPDLSADLLTIEAATPAEIQANDAWQQFLAGDREGGMAGIDAALEADPASPLANYFKASALLLDGDPSAAIPYFERVAATDSPLAELATSTLEVLRAD